MGQWQDWALKVDKVNFHKTLETASALRAEMDSIQEALPGSIDWKDFQRGYIVSVEGRPSSGPVLDWALGWGVDFKAAEPGTGGAMLLSIADELYARGARPGPRTMESGIHYAAARGDIERLRAALRWGALEVADKAALAPAALRAGASQAILEAISELGLFEGLDFRSCPLARQPIAAMAMNRGDEREWDALPWLLARGAPMDWRDPATGATLWHVAGSVSVESGKRLAAALAEHAPGLASAPMSAAVAAERGFGEGAKWGAGWTPAHVACDQLKPAVLARILAAGGSCDALDAKGDSPLLLLSRRFSDKAQRKAEPMVRELLAAGADPGRLDAKGRSAAQNMAAKGSLGALEPLLAVRPQDVGGEDSQAKIAFGKLAARGELGLSRAEEAAMEASLGKAGPKPSKGKPKAL